MAKEAAALLLSINVALHSHRCRRHNDKVKIENAQQDGLQVHKRQKTDLFLQVFGYRQVKDFCT